jgi:transposase
VTIDEAAVEHQIEPEFVYAPIGKKVIGEVSGKARGRTGLVAGLCAGTVIAACRFTGTMTTKLFLQWLEEELIPRLRPGQIVLMDNASYHRSRKVRRRLNAHGIGCWYLPKYSPDLNPIENYWAWLKRLIKKWRRSVRDFNLCLWIALHSVYRQLKVN